MVESLVDGHLAVNLEVRILGLHLCHYFTHELRRANLVDTEV